MLIATAIPLSAQGIAGERVSSFPGLKVVSECQDAVPDGGRKISSRAVSRAKGPSIQNLRINGFMMYDDDRSEDVKGFYEYSITSPVSRIFHYPEEYDFQNLLMKSSQRECHN